MDPVTRLEGRVEQVGGRLMLRIPLAEGGQELVECTRGLAYVEDGILCIPLPSWLAEELSISEGTVVVVDNENGKFNLFVAD